MVVGMTMSQNGDASTCTGCLLGKQHRKPFPSLPPDHKRQTKLELIHTDLCGPMSIASPSRKKYLLTFIDDCTRRIWVCFLHSKSEVLTCFQHFKSAVETETGLAIKAVRSDNGGEYTSNDFKAFCQEHGISQEFTEVYTPQQNGVAERANRTLLEMARAMLYQSTLPQLLWAEAIMTAAYLRNRCPTKILQAVTPEEAWTDHKPDVSHLRAFGCLAFCHIPDAKRSKLDAKSRPCIFLGYEKTVGTYTLIDPARNFTLVRSRDVAFEEDKSGADLYK